MVDQQSIHVDIPRWKQRLYRIFTRYRDWRFFRGYWWAVAKWRSRDVDWSNSSFDQVDRDGYCVALLQGKLDIQGPKLSPYYMGIRHFLRELVDGLYPTPLKYTDHPLFKDTQS